ncbi:MAG: PQQ-dependent sugar dehydrogenase [Chloroflexota bacterium]
MKFSNITFYFSAFSLLLTSCSIFTEESAVNGDVITPEVVAAVAEPTLTPTNTPPPPPPTVVIVEEAEGDLLPDLNIAGVSIDQPDSSPGCLYDGFQLGIRVLVSNEGSLPVGPFEISVNDEVIVFEDQIVPGDRTSVWFDQSQPAVVMVDPNNLIAETDESNNLFNQQIPVPTPPVDCTPTPEPTPLAAPVDDIQLDWVAGGFAKPLFVTHAADDRLFVVEQQGTIRVVNSDGSVGNTPFLNIIDRTNSGRNEQGLLGLAFHPDYTQNGRFFVNYTHADGSTVISEFWVTGDPNVADPASERQIIKIAQPFANHNGGMVAFGPDGYLYIGMGDGGSQNDPENHAQNLESLLGKILRIDIDNGEPYTIPADNPFVNDTAARNEIWSVGWRNPWRFSFDPANGDMFIADVGQNEIEEISLNPAGVGGLNFGWRIFEGNNCYLDDCTTPNLEPAIAQYTHVNGHCSVTGGYMHRGSENASLYGNYFYADYCSSQMWRLFPNADGSFSVAELERPGFFISSFGEDANGEVYVVNQVGGEIYKIMPAQ